MKKLTYISINHFSRFLNVDFIEDCANYIKSIHFRNMKRLVLVEKVREIGLKHKDLQLLLEAEVLKEVSCDNEVDFKDKVRRFITNLKTKLDKHGRNYERLLKHEVEWLSKDLFPDFVFSTVELEDSGAGPSVQFWGRQAI